MILVPGQGEGADAAHFISIVFSDGLLDVRPPIISTSRYHPGPIWRGLFVGLRMMLKGPENRRKLVVHMSIRDSNLIPFHTHSRSSTRFIQLWPVTGATWINTCFAGSLTIFGRSVFR